MFLVLCERRNLSITNIVEVSVKSQKYNQFFNLLNLKECKNL